MKPLDWVGSSLRDLKEFPRPVQTRMGYALKLAQLVGRGVIRRMETEEPVSDRADIPISTPSSGNVFADLGLPDAEELDLKAELVYRVSRIIGERGLTQTQAATILGVNQPKVSALLRGHLDGFSVERLLRFLNALDLDVEIAVRPKAQERGRTRVA